MLSTVAFSQTAEAKKVGPPEGKAMVGEVYGARVSAKAEKSAMTTKKLDQKLKKSAKVENVAVKGKVVNVCDKKGCWFTVETENNEKFFVKMKDYAFFPVSPTSTTMGTKDISSSSGFISSLYCTAISKIHSKSVFNFTFL